MAPPWSSRCARLVLALLCTLVGCDDQATGSDASAALTWFRTCGDPVCHGYTPDGSLPSCTTETVGQTCTAAGSTCVIANDSCNAHLTCASSDPATQCPISLRSAKRDIHYLDDRERAEAARALEGVRLARYRYRDEPGDAPDRLGFLIDDQAPGSPAVLPNGQRVDLYGYTSLAVAAIQTQAASIEALEREVEALREEVRRLHEERAVPAFCGP
ncbi:MAG: hypothetical protein U0230_22405 [Polyangiales bacterium]